MAQDLHTQNVPAPKLVAQIPRRIAVGVDGFSTGDDAAVLGAALARATDADLVLVTVHPDPIIVLPPELDWKGMHEQARRQLRHTRRTLAPAARTIIETDFSAARALARVVHNQRCDLLVLGSTRKSAAGRVKIGSATRQLLGHARCHLALAPQGLRGAAPVELRRIAVGYDGATESSAALALAAALAARTGAVLQVVAVVDDRLPSFPWGGVQLRKTVEVWDELLESERVGLEHDAQGATASLEPAAEVSAVFGSPAEVLGAASEQADLLVIGSRRWGAVAHVLLGGIGEALLHGGAHCPVLVAARPLGS